MGIELRDLVEPEHRGAPLRDRGRWAVQPLHALTVDLDDMPPGGIATSLEDRAGVRSPLEHQRSGRRWTRRLAAAAMKEIAPRAAGALVGNVLSEHMLEPRPVAIQAQLEVTPNRPPVWTRPIVLALDVVVLADESFEHRDLNGPVRTDMTRSLACVSGTIIGTDP